MSEYNEKLCDEKHGNIKDILIDHENRLNGHSKRLDTMETENSAIKTEIKNLCEQLKNLTTTLKWFIGLLVGSFVAFFFYAVQQNIFK